MKEPVDMVYITLLILTVVLVINIAIENRFGSNWLFASIPITALLGMKVYLYYAEV